jgi:hypothetical protein
MPGLVIGGGTYHVRNNTVHERIEKHDKKYPYKNRHNREQRSRAVSQQAFE